MEEERLYALDEDIKILERMRDNIYGEMLFEDDFQVRLLEQKQFDALNLAINHLRKIKLVSKLVYSKFIPKSKIKEKIEELKKCLTDTNVIMISILEKLLEEE